MLGMSVKTERSLGNGDNFLSGSYFYCSIWELGL